MSLSASCIAYDAETGDPVAKLILIELADWADEYGRTTVSNAALAKFAQVDADGVRRALVHLKDAGFITAHEADESGRRVIQITGASDGN